MAIDIYAGYDAYSRHCFNLFDRGIINSPHIRTFGARAYREWLKIKQRQAEAEAAALVEAETPEPEITTPKTIKEKYEYNLNYLSDFIDKIVDILKTETILDSDDTENEGSSILEPPDSPNTERKQTAKDIIERLKLFSKEIPDDITLDTINQDNFLFSLSYKKIALLKNKVTDDTKTLTNPELETKKNELLIYMIPVLQEVSSYFTLSFLDEKVEYLNKIFENYTPFVLQNIDNNRDFYFSYNFVDFKLKLYMYSKDFDYTSLNNSSKLERKVSRMSNTVQPNPEPPPKDPETDTETEDLTIPETEFYLEVQKKRYDSEGIYLPYKIFAGFNDKILSNVFNYIDKLWLLDTYCNKN